MVKFGRIEFSGIKDDPADIKVHIDSNQKRQVEVTIWTHNDEACVLFLKRSRLETFVQEAQQWLASNPPSNQDA